MTFAVILSVPTVMMLVLFTILSLTITPKFESILGAVYCVGLLYVLWRPFL